MTVLVVMKRLRELGYGSLSDTIEEYLQDPGSWRSVAELRGALREELTQSRTRMGLPKLRKPKPSEYAYDDDYQWARDAYEDYLEEYQEEEAGFQEADELLSELTATAVNPYLEW